MIAMPEDVTARLGRPVADDAEAARIAAFIHDATALVLDWCQTDFEQHQDETVSLIIEGGQAEIPQRLLPGLSVSTVVLDGRQLLPDEWQIIGRTLYLRHGPQLGTATLTASWGWPTVPAAVLTAICGEVIRWLTVSPGTVMERTGELEVQYQPTAAAVGLSPAARAILSRYRRRAGSLTLHRTRTRPSSEVITWPCSPIP